MRRWTLWCVLAVFAVVGCHAAGRAPHYATTTPTGRGSIQPAPFRGGAQSVSGVSRKLGSTLWAFPASRQAGPLELAGYTDRVSVRSGQSFRLFVTSTAGAFTVRAFRIGWYGGTGARLVWTSRSVPGVAQAAWVFGPDRMVTTHWQPSLTVPTTGWLPGSYLLLLTAANGKEKYVPITVRSNSTRGAIVIVNAVNTYQAYNAWGGYSLYHGPHDSFAARSYKVSFDRPYDDNGAQSLVHFELPLIQLAEQSGVRLAYLTSVDVASDPTALVGARGILSLGHDEYWSLSMRAAVTKARDAGTNVAFLGANAVYWRVRYESSPLGPDRIMVGYKDATLDPVHDRPDTTVRWRSNPFARPENSLTGMLYVCDSWMGSFVVRDPGFFLFAGTGVVQGTTYTGLAVTEVDHPYRMAGTPANLQVAANSRVMCGWRLAYSDATYYTVPSGAGVFATGSMEWVPALRGPDPQYGLGVPGVRFARTVTLNLIRSMAAGPLGDNHPANGDLATLPASATA